jgi:hypothetical protein
MRKMLMLLFVMMMFSILAVPAFAQTGGKWGRGHQLGCDHLWFRNCNRSGAGGTRPGQGGRGGLRRLEILRRVRLFSSR